MSNLVEFEAMIMMNLVALREASSMSLTAQKFSNVVGGACLLAMTISLCRREDVYNWSGKLSIIFSNAIASHPL